MAEQLIRLEDRAAGVRHLFQANATAMLKSAPRTTSDPNRLLRIALNAIAFDDKLVTCTHRSILGGVMEAIKLGLTIGGPMQEAWLIPFGTDATLIVGYQGYRNIIDRAKSTLDLHPRAVYAEDFFEMELGTNPRIRHQPYWLAGKTEQGALIAVYAVAHLRGGGLQLEVMPRAEVDEHRNRSRAKNSGPWVTDYDAMALKTVVRKIAKYLPKSNELLARALDLDDKADRGVPQDLDTSGLQVFDEGPAPAAATTSGLDKLKDAIRGDRDENAAIDAEIAEREGGR